MKKEELKELIREVVIEELNKLNNKSEEKENNNYDYDELLELFKNDKEKNDCIIHFIELGKNPTKLEVGNYFANSNLYEREENTIMKHYGHFLKFDSVMEILTLKDRIRGKNRLKF